MSEVSDVWCDYCQDWDIDHYDAEDNHKIGIEYGPSGRDVLGMQLLQEAHDKMDDYNARHNPEQTVAYCMWCLSEGYGPNGLIHDDLCILVRMRHVLSGT